MPAHGDVDPWLRHASWKRAVRYWQGQHKVKHLDCARCGEPIDRRLKGQPRGPWHLDVGHIVGRVQARALGWTVEQANDLRNTQPEHARCGRQAGAREGNTARRATLTRPVPVTSRRW